jgi:hypothetical protein
MGLFLKVRNVQMPERRENLPEAARFSGQQKRPSSTGLGTHIYFSERKAVSVGTKGGQPVDEGTRKSLKELPAESISGVAGESAMRLGGSNSPNKLLD